MLALTDIPYSRFYCTHPSHSWNNRSLNGQLIVTTLNGSMFLRSRYFIDIFSTGIDLETFGYAKSDSRLCFLCIVVRFLLVSCSCCEPDPLDEPPIPPPPPSPHHHCQSVLCKPLQRRFSETASLQRPVLAEYTSLLTPATSLTSLNCWRLWSVGYCVDDRPRLTLSTVAPQVRTCEAARMFRGEIKRSVDVSGRIL